MAFYSDRVLPHLLNAIMGTKQLADIRRRVCLPLKGDIVEIGFGAGHNLPYLPSGVTTVRAVEPSTVAVRLARRRMDQAGASVEVVGLDGQMLPLRDSSTDAVLCTWSLCTIPDPVTAVNEMRRVLRPGGTLHFAEHGRAPDAGVLRWQNRLNGMQRRLAGGCNLNRDIPAILQQGGFHITALSTYYNEGEPRPYGYTYEGIATANP